jgi:hypothetical protein
MCLVVLVLLVSTMIPTADAHSNISRNRHVITPMKGQDGNERKTTMAETFHKHHQQITTQRRMRVRSTKTGRNANANSNVPSVGSKRRGGGGTGGRNKRGSVNKRTNGNKNSRANNNVGNVVSRNKNSNVDGGNTKRGERNGNKQTGKGRRGGKNRPETKNGVRGGHQRNVNRGNTGTEKGNKADGEISTRSREKAQRNKESIASAVVKKGILLVPVQTPATNEKAKAGK